jgi:Fe-S cluster assembly protein SufD
MLPDVEATNLPALNELGVEQLGTDERRREALQAALSLESPVWRRTDLRRFDPWSMRPSFGNAEIQVPSGVEQLYVADLQRALAERPEVIGKYWGQAVPTNFNKYTAFNAALARDGVVVHVPRNLEVAEPVRVRYRLPEGGVAVLPRTMVVAEANSRVTVIEEYVSGELSGAGMVVPVAEVFVLDGASVEFVSLQTLDRQAYQLGAQAANVGRDARIRWISGAVGASVQHVDMDVRLEGNGAELDWLGFTFGVGDQQLLWAPRVHHIGLSTTAQIQWKSAVADTAYVVFDGMINIEHGAQGTNSDLRDNVLHLSPMARSDSIPGLEIDANEVKAGHGSTSGQIDDEQIFYLRSRGMSRAEAMRAIVLGFFASIVEQITLEDVRDHVLELIEGKI